MITISKDDFRQIYKGTSVIANEDIFYSTPANQKDLEENYIASKLWRINHLYTIVNKHGQLVTFKMNKSQHKVYAASLRHPRLIILKSRQQGISTFWLVSFFDDACTKANLSIGLMAQGTDEAATLLTRVKLLWDKLPAAFKTYLGLKIMVDNTKALSMSNGSNIFVRTSFRSTTLQRLHISEMGKIANKYPEKAKETKTGTLQALAPGNTGVIESTAEGDNLFKGMWDNAMQHYGQLSAKDFLPVFLSWLEDPDCVEPNDQIITDKQAKYFAEIEQALDIQLSRQQKNFWITQYRELGDDIYQEYPTTPIEAFMSNKDGAYYARLYLEWVKKYNREIEGLYDPNLDVTITVDLGMDDTNVLIAHQEYTDGVRIIDEIIDNGKGIRYYTDILKEKPYYDNITRLVLPHDAEVREHTTTNEDGSGKTRLQAFEEELPHLIIDVLEKFSRQDGIEAVRQMIQRLYIDPKCQYIISCFFNYTKEFDDKRNRWRNIPLHNEFSNGADAVRYLATGRDSFVEVVKKRRLASRDNNYRTEADI